MMIPPYRKDYEILFSRITGISGPVKSSYLLQGYATFSAMCALNTSANEAYKTVREQNRDYKFSLLSGVKITFSADWQVLTKQFTQLSLCDFLLFVVPDIACEPLRLMEYRRKYQDALELDDMQLVHHIIQIKLNSYQKITSKAKLHPGDSAEEVLMKIYEHYLSQETNHPLPRNAFYNFYQAINTYSLDPKELSVRISDVSETKFTELLDILFNQLQMTRSQILDVICSYYVHNKQSQAIVEDQIIYNFISNKNNNERAKLLRKALRILAKISPLELICAVSIRKKKGVTSEHKHTESLILPNDVTLENGLVYALFFSEIASAAGREICILFPSPHFVRKVLSDPKLIDHCITFVFKDGNIADALTFQAKDGTYAPQIGTSVSFVSYSDWLKQNSSEKAYAFTMLFGTNLTSLEHKEAYETVLEYSSRNASVLALEPSILIERYSHSPMDFPGITTAQLALIPQNINNSTLPRRKVILRFTIDKTVCASLPASDQNVQIYTYTLNTVLKKQALSLIHEEPVTVALRDFGTMRQTLRGLYSQEILKRHASGRIRNSSFPHEITPDIIVWCSKTYPKNNLARPRLEAYVCRPAPSSIVGSGYSERGAIISSTKKHVTKIANDNILDWLENDYPFSTVSGRSKSSREQAGNESLPANTVTYIRDEIISHYTEYLKGQDIAFKTLWYLYPNLADLYSKSDYDCFSKMMQTVIGQQRISDLTAEECEYLLITEYPNLSHANLMNRFSILSTAIDKAVEYGYCPANNLRAALRQARIHDKLFAQVRCALTKKHFTKSQMQQAYRFLINKLEHDNQYEYLGVLIRLMTGLESSIVCALRWCDLNYSSEYDLCSFVITRQISSDGQISGFRDAEDYLCFPLPRKLQKILLAHKSDQEPKDARQPIVTSSANEQDQQIGLNPKKLNDLTREMISSAGIDERIVVLPDQNSGSRETDLNKYNGDFIRENFRYWSTQYGLLNADELAYLLRNKPPTTLGSYYCDFLNESSQLILQAKLSRWESAICENVQNYTRKHKPCTTANYYNLISPNEASRKAIIIELSTEKKSVVCIGTESPYGVSCDITVAETEV